MDQATVALFFQLETGLHRKEVRNSPAQVSELLADDFIEFGSSGLIHDKAVVLQSMKVEPIDWEITVKDFAARYLADDVVLVTYAASKLEPVTKVRIESLRSSIWKRTAGRWQMVFHQGTKLK